LNTPSLRLEESNANLTLNFYIDRDIPNDIYTTCLPITFSRCFRTPAQAVAIKAVSSSGGYPNVKDGQGDGPMKGPVTPSGWTFPSPSAVATDGQKFCHQRPCSSNRPGRKAHTS
jgi:hypothetical protein